MTLLATLQQQSIDFYAVMAGQFGPDNLAGPFVSVDPRGHYPKDQWSVFYVGQATRGNWGRYEFDAGPNLFERRSFTQEFLLSSSDLGSVHKSNFWRFAYRLSAVVARTEHSVPYLGNLIWSNLAKIGTQSGNPHGQYLSAQIDLNIDMLRAEIDEYQPTLIVIAAGLFGGLIIEGAIAKFDSPSWEKENDDDGYWWRLAVGKMPPVLFTNRPGRAPRSDKEKWLSCARQLIEPS